MIDPINQFPVKTIFTDQHNISIQVARLDLIHPIVSGNKLYKLIHSIEEAISLNKQCIITKGGPFSNHLLATAYYCKDKKIQSVGIVRGALQQNLNHTLQACATLGMKLIFVSIEEYNSIQALSDLQKLPLNTGDCFFIPEGGYHPLGAKGASMIMNHPELKKASHICTAVGTATTLAGLIMNANPQQEIIAIPVLKGMTDIPSRLDYLVGNQTYKKPTIWDDYHFGGYAKSTAVLIEFMNTFYEKYQIPTDFVYTGKAFYGVINQYQKNYFPKESKIVILHTGGLQGNLSKSAHTFIF